MKTNIIISITISIFLGFTIPLQHFILSGMNPVFGIIINVILVLLMFLLIGLFLLQKVKKYKMVQLGVAFLCIFIGTVSQLFVYDFDVADSPRYRTYKTTKN